MKQEVYLTTFELLHTYGFLKIMSIIWMPFIISMATILIYIKNIKQDKGDINGG